MPTRLSISFTESTTEIAEPVTKFGGNPGWLTEPQWPLSRSLNRPMRFVCQIVIPEEIGGEALSGKLGYFFVTDE